MKRSKLIVACVLGTILVVGWVSLGRDREQRQAPIHQIPSDLLVRFQPIDMVDIIL
jgi:hypothetical protein